MAHGVDTEIKYDAVVVPQKMRHNRPLQMTENVGLGVGSATTQPSCTDPKAKGSIDLGHVSSEVHEEREDMNSESEAESYTVQKVALIPLIEVTAYRYSRHIPNIIVICGKMGWYRHRS